jgi:hypothetical protein
MNDGQALSQLWQEGVGIPRRPGYSREGLALSDLKGLQNSAKSSDRFGRTFWLYPR